MPTTCLRRMLLAIALSTAAAATVAGPPAAASPTAPVPTTVAPVVPSVPPTIPGTTTTTTPTRSAPAPEEPFEFGDAVDWAKDHLAPIIGVVGVLLVIGLWKIVSRGPSRKF